MISIASKAKKADQSLHFKFMVDFGLCHPSSLYSCLKGVADGDIMRLEDIIENGIV
jgi:hypothetical protein